VELKNMIKHKDIVGPLS